jgi:hypothetical protein
MCGADHERRLDDPAGWCWCVAAQQGADADNEWQDEQVVRAQHTDEEHGVPGEPVVGVGDRAGEGVSHGEYAERRQHTALVPIAERRVRTTTRGMAGHAFLAATR